MKHLSLIVPLLKYAAAPPFARRLAHHYQGLDNCIWQLFGHTAQPQIPIAALTYQYDISTPNTDWLMRADPVHLRLDRQAAYLLDAAFIGISTEESVALIDSIQQYQSDFQIVSTQPERWYIRQTQAIDLQALRLEQIRGANITNALPTGADAAYWRKIGNEIQMLFYDHPVNQQRRSRGQAEINSLWFWGVGQLPALANSPWQQVFSQHILSQSLAKQQQIRLQTPPDNANMLLEKLTMGATLVHLDLQQEQDISQWQEDWLAPLQLALEQKHLDSVHVYSETNSYALRCPSWFRRFLAKKSPV